MTRIEARLKGFVFTKAIIEIFLLLIWVPLLLLGLGQSEFLVLFYVTTFHVSDIRKNCLYLECDEIERLQIQPVDSIPGVHRNDLRTDEKKTKVNFFNIQ